MLTQPVTSPASTSPGSKDLSPANKELGAACQSQEAACCKEGKIFLPEGQYQAICRYLQTHECSSTTALQEFQERCEQHDGFWLYDQRARCQFLGPQNRCGLYATGVRPLECLWWPLHAYLGDGGQVEVRSATWCCTAAAAAAGQVHAELVEESAEQTGVELIRRFREVYPGRPGPLLRVIAGTENTA